MTSTCLSRKTLVCYSMGSIVETSIYGFCGLYLLNFYTDVVQLSPALIGYALSIRFFIDALSDPAIGYLSDNSQSSKGRRRPFFIPGVLIGVVAFYLLLTPPVGWSEAALFVYLVITSSTLFMSLTVFGIPYLALSWELSSDYHERTRISSYRRFFEVFAEIGSNLLVPVMLALSITGLSTEKECYPVAAICIGMVCIISVLITRYGVSENQHQGATFRYSFFEGVRFAFRNKPFLLLLITFTLVAVSDRVCMALIFYLLEYLHGIPKQETIPYFLTFFLGSLISPGLWLFLGGVLGKKPAYIAAMIFWGLAFGSLAVQQWSPTGLHLIVMLMGVASSGVLTMPGAIIPDVIELDQIHTGQRREGIYAGIAKFSWKIGTSSCFLVIGYLLTEVGYEGKEPTQSTLDGMRTIFIGGPGVLIILAVSVFSFFPINRETFQRIQNIARKREQHALDQLDK